MIKRRALAVGLDGAFAGHSLRAGFATEGYAQGTPELAIMRHGRWRSASVMRGPRPHSRREMGQASPESATRLRRSKSCPRSGVYRTLRPITPLSTGLTPSKVRLTTSGFGVSATAQTPAGAMLAW
jgi:hypothetical protein